MLHFSKNISLKDALWKPTYIFIGTYMGCYYAGIACSVSEKPPVLAELGGFFV